VIELLDAALLQSICEVLATEDRVCARFACRASCDGCREADATVGAVRPGLKEAPFFCTVSLVAWYTSNQPGGLLSEHVLVICAEAHWRMDAGALTARLLNGYASAARTAQRAAY